MGTRTRLPDAAAALDDLLNQFVAVHRLFRDQQQNRSAHISSTTSSATSSPATELSARTEAGAGSAVWTETPPPVGLCVACHRSLAARAVDRAVHRLDRRDHRPTRRRPSAPTSQMVAVAHGRNRAGPNIPSFGKLASIVEPPSLSLIVRRYIVISGSARIPPTTRNSADAAWVDLNADRTRRLPRTARGPRMCQSVRKAATVLAWNADQHSLRRDTALVLTGIRKPLPRRQFHWSEQYSTCRQIS